MPKPTGPLGAHHTLHPNLIQRNCMQDGFQRGCVFPPLGENQCGAERSLAALLATDRTDKAAPCHRSWLQDRKFRHSLGSRHHVCLLSFWFLEVAFLPSGIEICGILNPIIGDFVSSHSSFRVIRWRNHRKASRAWSHSGFAKFGIASVAPIPQKEFATIPASDHYGSQPR